MSLYDTNYEEIKLIVILLKSVIMNLILSVHYF